MSNDIFKNIIKKMYNFEDEEETIECANCGEQVPEDYGRLTETDGFICEQCLIDGYGE